MLTVTAATACAAILIAIDLIWLGLVAKPMYKSALGPFLRDRVDPWPAVAFYIVHATGTALFAVMPALETGSWSQAARLGMMFGFFCYATYNLTNLATLRDWPLRLSLLDLGWGAVLTGATAVCAFLVTSWIVGPAN